MQLQLLDLLRCWKAGMYHWHEVTEEGFLSDSMHLPFHCAIYEKDLWKDRAEIKHKEVWTWLSQEDLKFKSGLGHTVSSRLGHLNETQSLKENLKEGRVQWWCAHPPCARSWVHGPVPHMYTQGVNMLDVLAPTYTQIIWGVYIEESL